MRVRKDVGTLMVGMKEKLGDGYEAWYKRHRVVENQRVWRKVMEENPVPWLPDYERELPETYSLLDAFYHKPGCYCGSCVGPIGRLAKILHVDHFKDEPWVRAASSPIPEPPDRLLPLLQDVEAIVKSPQDHS